MIKSLVTVLFALAISPSLALAQGRSAIGQKAFNTVDKSDEVGLGLQVGSFSGINLEYWMARDRTLNASIAGERGNTVLQAAHTWMFRGALPGEFRTSFVPFVGLGLIGAWGDRSDYFERRQNENFALAIQAPLGIEFLPHLQRFGVFAEISPSFEVAPEGFAFLTGDLGARFYF